MCVPSRGRVPAGHGAPVQAGDHPQRGVSPSTSLEAESHHIGQLAFSIQESPHSTCHAPSSAEITGTCYYVRVS